MEDNLDEFLEFGLDIAKHAGEIMKKYFNENNGSSYKSDNTIVTSADLEINHYLIKRVKETYPDHSVYGEEESLAKSYKEWICDPVDGTAMYARQIPVAVFSLSYCVNGIPLVGIIYDPFTENMYTAIKHKGAFKNGERIHVSEDDFDNMKTIVNIDCWPTADYDILPVVNEIQDKTYLVAIGSVIHAGALVADGKFDAAIFPGTVNKNVDMPAVKIIVEEAGGMVTNFIGENDRYDEPKINGAIISNKVLYPKLLNLVEKYAKDRTIEI